MPALLSGATCCGPAFLLLVGVQASATLVGVVSIAVPASAVVLVLVGRGVTPQPTAVD